MNAAFGFLFAAFFAGFAAFFAAFFGAAFFAAGFFAAFFLAAIGCLLKGGRCDFLSRERHEYDARKIKKHARDAIGNALFSQRKQCFSP
jgi:predicted phage tail protein